MMAQFTKRQWLTLIVISIADFANAICVSLQAPFYPQEAEKKGASPSEYGLVFGIFEFIVFIISLCTDNTCTESGQSCCSTAVS